VHPPNCKVDIEKIFEDKFSKYIGANYSFAVNNATNALELSAQLCQFRRWR